MKTNWRKLLCYCVLDNQKYWLNETWHSKYRMIAPRQLLLLLPKKILSRIGNNTQKIPRNFFENRERSREKIKEFCHFASVGTLKSSLPGVGQILRNKIVAPPSTINWPKYPTTQIQFWHNIPCAWTWTCFRLTCKNVQANSTDN